MLVTVEQAIRHLRLDDDSSPADPDLLLKLTQAEAIIFGYLHVPSTASIDGDPDASPVVEPYWNDRDRSNVQTAILLILSALWDDEEKRTVADYMTAPNGSVVLLLARLRDPVLA